MVFVTILLIDLGNEAASLGLLFPLVEHPLMQWPGPLLEGGHAEPIGGPILMFGVDRMAFGQMAIGGNAPQISGGGNNPGFLTKNVGSSPGSQVTMREP